MVKKVIFILGVFIMVGQVANAQMSETKSQIFFNALNKDTMDLVYDFYDRDIQFIDPIVEIQGVEDLKQYYANMYAPVKDIYFEFISEVDKGDETVLIWKMTMTAKKLNKGKPIVLDGISYIKFGGKEGKAIYHRDYFDMGEMIYQYVPVLRSMVGYVNKRMRKHHDPSYNRSKQSEK